MTQATTTHTNTPRRAYPAAVRAALRSHKSKQPGLVGCVPRTNIAKAVRGTHPTISTRYTYDPANRRVTENHYLTAGAATPVKTIGYTWNTLDRLTGHDDGATTATSTAYNAIGQKTGLTYPDGAQYTYTYDANNQLSTVNLPAGSGSITINSYTWTVPAQITLPGGTVRTQSFDGLLRLKDLAVKDPGQSQVLNYQ